MTQNIKLPHTLVTGFLSFGARQSDISKLVFNY